MQQKLIDKRYFILLIAMVCVAVAGYWIYSQQSATLPAASQAPNYSVKKQLRYRFSVQNESKEKIESAVFRVFVPVKQTATQRVEDIRANFDFTVVDDDLGNQMLEFDFGQFSPFERRIVRVEVDMAMAAGPVPQEIEHVDPYLQEEPYIELSEKLITKVSSKVQASSATVNSSIPRGAFNWLVENITPVDYISEDRGALWALQKQQGDCTEFMYAFIALMRSNGVPARGIAGFVVDEKPVSVLKAGQYHNWAEYLERQTWRLSDAQKQIFDSQYSNYVAFRIFSEDASLSMNNSQRFLSFDQRLTVRMI